jgi:hypothetical protein
MAPVTAAPATPESVTAPGVVDQLLVLRVPAGSRIVIDLPPGRSAGHTPESVHLRVAADGAPAAGPGGIR